MKQLLAYARNLPLIVGRYRRELVWVAAGLALTIPLGYAAKLRIDEASARRQGIVLTASGIVSVGRVEVFAEVPGVVREAPRSGASVQQGQLLARLENIDLDVAVAVARSQLDAAKSSLANARGSGQAENLASLDNAVKVATAALEAAQKAAANVNTSSAMPAQPPVASSTSSQTSKALVATAGQGGASHHAAIAARTTITAMHGHGGAPVSLPVVQRPSTQVSAVGKAGVAGTAAGSKVVKTPATSGQQDQLRAQVETARLQLEQAKARRAEAVASGRPEATTEAHSQVQQAQIALAQAQQNLLKAAVVAPVSGSVLEVAAAPGTQVNIGQPLVVLGDDANTYVALRVRSKQAMAVESGQKAVVTVGDRTINGWVDSIALDSDSSWTSVKISLELQDLRLTDGVTAKVMIVAETER